MSEIKKKYVVISFLITQHYPLENKTHFLFLNRNPALTLKNYFNIQVRSFEFYVLFCFLLSFASEFSPLIHWH